MRRRISLLEHKLDSLASVAMHPQARSALAKAKLDLNTAALRLTGGIDGNDLENLDASLRLTDVRLEHVRNAIAADGPFALPALPEP